MDLGITKRLPSVEHNALFGGFQRRWFQRYMGTYKVNVGTYGYRTSVHLFIWLFTLSPAFLTETQGELHNVLYSELGQIWHGSEPSNTLKSELTHCIIVG